MVRGKREKEVKMAITLKAARVNVGLPDDPVASMEKFHVLFLPVLS